MGFYRANMATDQPQPYEPKRIIFYAAGLKIYGLLPFMLNRRVRGEFISNYWHSSPGGISIVCPTWEQNYTIVGYAQPEIAASVLLDWLYADAGFSWGIAAPEYWADESLRMINFYQPPPDVWHPAGGEARPGFARVVRGQRPERADLCALLLAGAE